jgi:hypothetical protein
METLERVRVGWWIAPKGSLMSYWRVTRKRGECWVQASNDIALEWFWLPELLRDGWVRVP